MSQNRFSSMPVGLISNERASDEIKEGYVKNSRKEVVSRDSLKKVSLQRNQWAEDVEEEYRGTSTKTQKWGRACDGVGEDTGVEDTVGEDTVGLRPEGWHCIKHFVRSDKDFDFIPSGKLIMRLKGRKFSIPLATLGR